MRPSVQRNLQFGMNKNNIMKTTINICNLKMVIALMAICSSVFMSCSSEDDVVTPQVDYSTVYCEAAPILTQQLGSRSSLSYTSGKMVFQWDGHDCLTVFAKDVDNETMLYTIITQDSYSHQASFHSDGFGLTADKIYYALSKKEGYGGGSETRIPDQRNISIDYSGQEQRGNANPAHLGKYDFMGAAAKCEENNGTQFSFKHLGSTLRIVLMSKDTDENFKNYTFTNLEIYDSGNSFVQPVRHFSFANGLDSDGNYEPVWPAQTLNNPTRFSVALRDADGNNGVKPSEDFNDGSGTNEYKDLVVYAEVPPTDFTGKKVNFILSGYDSANGNAPVLYYATDYHAESTHTNFNLEAGHAYVIYAYANQTEDYLVTLKVNRMWQHGYTSRATGDPGYDKEYNLPSNVYLFFCAGGVIKQITSYNPAKADWIPNADETVFTLKTDVGKTTTLFAGQGLTETQKSSLRVYAIAADEEIAHGLAVNGSEDAVKNLVYTYNGQDKMRDLYSTPWVDNATFIGNLNEPVKDIILYHVAAKVDLKWNSPTILTGNVSVNNFQKNNISIFQPTTNGSTTEFTGTLTATESTPITTNTQWNGRQVYYLPQPSDGAYNVTIGSHIHDGTHDKDGGTTGTLIPKVTFSPNTEGGYTSWLRWLKQY